MMAGWGYIHDMRVQMRRTKASTREYCRRPGRWGAGDMPSPWQCPTTCSTQMCRKRSVSSSPCSSQEWHVQQGSTVDSACRRMCPTKFMTGPPQKEPAQPDCWLCEAPVYSIKHAFHAATEPAVSCQTFPELVLDGSEGVSVTGMACILLL